MSTHCNKYPTCGCPKEIGTRCGFTDQEIKGLNSGRLTTKTGSDCELMVVDNPNRFNSEGQYQKARKKNTHLTPKKKKRK